MTTHKVQRMQWPLAASIVVAMLLPALFGTWPLPRDAGFLHGMLAGAVSALCLCAVRAEYRKRQRQAVSFDVPTVWMQASIPPSNAAPPLTPWNPADTADRFSDPAHESGMARCTGFLDAMRLLNDEVSGCYADFFLKPLPPAGNLRDALAHHFEHYVSENHVVLHDGRRASDWRIHTEEVQLQKAFVARVCADWFFQSEYMRTALRDSYRDGLVDSFLGLLEQGIGACTVHRVLIDPPCWYAIRWNLVAFERGGDRFLLGFSHSN